MSSLFEWLAWWYKSPEPEPTALQVWGPRVAWLGAGIAVAVVATQAARVRRRRRRARVITLRPNCGCKNA